MTGELGYLKHHLGELKLNRDAIEKKNTELQTRRKAWEEENQELITDIAVLRNWIDDGEYKIRATALELYAQTGDKKLFGGVGIRVGEKLLYSEEQAFTWAKEHSLALKLDTKTFETLAKTMDLPFVKKEEVITPTIPVVIKVDEVVP